MKMMAHRDPHLPPEEPEPEVNYLRDSLDLAVLVAVAFAASAASTMGAAPWMLVVMLAAFTGACCDLILRTYR